MEAEFWHERWGSNNIGFHEKKPNDLLIKHFNRLKLEKDSCLLLPLCGKTHDIAWLLSKGHRVVGVELSEIAIQQLFEELNLQPTLTQQGKLKHYSSNKLDIFAGDLFNCTQEHLKSIDAIYDRAALVALPKDMRMRYTSHLKAITQNAPQLLISFEYDQAQMEGPPFSISTKEIEKHYSDSYKITHLEECVVGGRLKSKVDAMEHIWLIDK
ncbi:MAG: thiopurine S-methyltransferase [Gammaproteobacteria bacterium]|jgi:thiopurine S-methyltransferase